MTTVSNSKSFARSRAVGGTHLALIGCNHRTAPVELRERVAFTSEQALEAAGELRKRGILEEAVVLSTCNRSELYGVPATSGPAVTDAMEDFLHQLPSNSPRRTSWAHSIAGLVLRPSGIFSAWPQGSIPCCLAKPKS